MKTAPGGSAPAPGFLSATLVLISGASARAWNDGQAGHRDLEGSDESCYPGETMVATSSIAELGEIQETFELSNTELAALFQRTASSLAEWELRGVPKERRATAERLAGIARLFRKNVIRSRIPEIVRTPDDWLGKRTILQVLATDGVDPIYVYLARLFAYNG